MVEEQFRWIPAMRETYARRLGGYERQVEQTYPGLLDQITKTVSGAAAARSWCPLPIGSVMAMGVPVQHASAVTAVAVWRLAGRHVAYIHPDRVPPPIEHVPCEEIKQLPAHCLYLATSDADGLPPSGLFVWLEYDDREDRTEVRMQVDHERRGDLWRTLPDPVHVVRGTLRDAVSATQTTALMRGSALLAVAMPAVGRGTELDALIDQKTVHQAHLLAAVAHLAAPTTQVLDAAAVLGQDDPKEWTSPCPDTNGLTLWLAA